MLRAARDILAIVTLALLSLCFWKLYDAIPTNGAGTLSSYQDLAKQLLPTLQQVNTATASQLRATAQIESEVEKTAADLKAAIAHTDWNLNGNPHLKIEGILPKAARSVDDLDIAEKQLTVEIQQADPILASLQQTARAIQVDVSDPAIPKTLYAFEQSAENAQKLTNDGAATIADVRKGVDYELAQLMKPVKKIKVIGEEAVSLAGRFFGYH